MSKPRKRGHGMIVRFNKKGQWFWMGPALNRCAITRRRRAHSVEASR